MLPMDSDLRNKPPNNVLIVQLDGLSVLTQGELATSGGTEMVTSSPPLPCSVPLMCVVDDMRSYRYYQGGRY